MTLIALRLIDRDLLPAILELDRLCFGGLWTLEGYEREIDSPNSELVAITLDQTLVGYGCLWSIVDEAHITIVAVHPDYRHQGLGQTLLLALLESAHQRGLERSTLEVRISNQSAIDLYRKFGFKVAGRRKGYYEDTGEDALILWRGGLQTLEFSDLLSKWATEVSDRLTRSNWAITVNLDTITRKKSFLTDS
ncbi:ribosomal protein S18-alanine N-acetyltransferase [Phormidesmis sp. 146-33]